VVVALNSLMEREGDTLVVKLPRTPGRKDAEYMHLFCGEVEVQAQAHDVPTGQAEEPSNRTSIAELDQRVSELENEVEKLKQLLQ
jgi:uncharacterized protein YceH (UPF0502 family)